MRLCWRNRGSLGRKGFVRETVLLLQGYHKPHQWICGGTEMMLFYPKADVPNSVLIGLIKRQCP